MNSPCQDLLVNILHIQLTKLKIVFILENADVDDYVEVVDIGFSACTMYNMHRYTHAKVYGLFNIIIFCYYIIELQAEITNVTAEDDDTAVLQ